AVGVGVMKLQSSQVKNEKNIDADYEVRILTSAIYDQLKNREACNQTFDDANFNSAFNFNVIRNAAGAALFQSNSQYKGKDVIQIVNFRAEPGSLQASAEDSSILEGSVRIAVSYQKSNNVLNNNNTYKKYLSLPLRVKTETSGKFLTCISASDEAIKTSLERFCKSLNGTYDGSTSPGTCDLDSND